MSNEEEKMSRKKLLFSTLLVAMLVVGSVAAVFVLTGVSPERDGSSPVDSVDEPEDLDVDDGMSWNEIPLASEVNPGAGTSGVVNVFIVDHSSVSYADGITESDGFVFEHGDADGFSAGEELTGTTPFDTAFDIAFEYQFSASQVYDASGGWNSSRCKAFINASNPSISSLKMSESSFFETGDGSDGTDGRITFYADAGGSGYTINVDGTITVDDIKVYYYG